MQQHGFANKGKLPAHVAKKKAKKPVSRNK
jgi:hypothetical protein